MLINEVPTLIRMKDKIGTTDMVSVFRLEYPIEQLSMTSQDISWCFEEIGLALTDLLINDNARIDLPYNLGTLSVITKQQRFDLDSEGKPKYLKIDYPSTYKAWENNLQMKEDKTYIYFINPEATYNSFKWWRKEIKLQNAQYYTLNVARFAARKLAAASKAGKKYIGAQKIKE